MTMTTSARRIPAIAALLIAGSLQSACGSDKPAVCSSINTLGASLSNIRAIDLKGTPLTEINDLLEQLKASFDQVKTDAKDEFSTEIAGVEDAAGAVRAALATAEADPSTAVATLRPALDDLEASLQTITDSVDDSC